ncbi:MAG: hypothetical protein WD067_07230 [Gaiellaceae bacterium]
MDALAERLARRTLELVDIPSVSREESPIVEHAAGLVPPPFELVHRRSEPRRVELSGLEFVEVVSPTAWTPVAEFNSRGIDAVNFGPGATRYAHKRDEQIEIAALVSAFETLRRFVSA